MSTKVHTEMIKKDFFNDKITSHEGIKSRAEDFIESINKAKTKMKSLVTEKLAEFLHFLQKSSRKVIVTASNDYCE